MITQILTYLGFAGVVTLGGLVWKLSWKMATIENDIKTNSKDIEKLQKEQDCLYNTLQEMKISIAEILTILKEREKHNG